MNQIYSILNEIVLAFDQTNKFSLPGVLEYYNANLENIMHYGELKTEVFQAFREAGNVIVFCLLIEQEMVSFFRYQQIFMHLDVFAKIRIKSNITVSCCNHSLYEVN